MLGHLLLASLAGISLAGSITDIKHVVLFMQENRAFDHVCDPITVLRMEIMRVTYLSSISEPWLA